MAVQAKIPIGVEGHQSDFNTHILFILHIAPGTPLVQSLPSHAEFTQTQKNNQPSSIIPNLSSLWVCILIFLKFIFFYGPLTVEMLPQEM